MPKAGSPPNLVVCVQCIQTYWDKSARGGMEAEARNRVPEALKLLSCQPLDTPLSYIVYCAYFSKSNVFVEPLKCTVETSLTEPLHTGGVSMSLLGNSLAVYYQWDNGQGAALRYSGRKEAFQVSVGQWGRVLYNGRYVDFDNGTWHYEKRVYNVGLFVSPSPSVFIKTEPVEATSYMALLR